MSTASLPSKQTDFHLELVKGAIMAPSPDNNQPWRFVSDGDRLLVYLDPDRALPSDVNAMFDLLGVGAAVENACIVAREHGYSPHVEYFAHPGESEIPATSEPVAIIKFASGGTSDPLATHLAARCTCRKFYSTNPVAECSLQAIGQAAGEFPQVQLDWVTDHKQIRSIARIIAASDRIRFEYEPFHNELFRQLRFSVAEADRTRDGLDLRTLELPPGAGLLLKALSPWSRMKWVHRLRLGSLLTLPSALAVRRSGALGVLSVSEPTTEQSLMGGRAFERIWLAAQAEGLALQPLGSLPIFFAHLQQYKGRKLCHRHEQSVHTLLERFQEIVPQGGGRTMNILFRLGHSAPPSFRSLRRTVKDVLHLPESPMN